MPLLWKSLSTILETCIVLILTEIDMWLSKEVLCFWIFSHFSMYDIYDYDWVNHSETSKQIFSDHHGGSERQLRQTLRQVVWQIPESGALCCVAGKRWVIRLKNCEARYKFVKRNTIYIYVKIFDIYISYEDIYIYIMIGFFKM